MNRLLLYIVVLHFAVLQDSTFRYVDGGQIFNLEDHLQPLDVGRNLTYDKMIDDDKLCSRDCTKYPNPRICYYKFVAEQYHAMGPACKNCPFERNDCFSPQCITAHGIERTVLCFNRMISGPAIHVCYGDRIIVDIQNKMPAREITIHWHGELQHNTQWMDGVPHVTQCPITENSNFRYDFYAHTIGTLFYHSHSAIQLFDGLSGSLITRTSKKIDPHAGLYDFDLFSHTVHIQDWMHIPLDDKYPGQNKNLTLITIKPDTYLINGKGGYMNPVTLEWTGTPFAEFKVRPQKRYRFRIIGATSTTCSYRFTIENHSMTLIATDGYLIEPQTVRTLYMSSGTRYDVIINTNQIPRSYWIRVQGYSGECIPAFQQAILRYEGTGEKMPPSLNTEALFDALSFPEWNNVRRDCRHTDDNLCLDEIRSLYKAPQRLLEEPDERYILRLQAHVFTPEELYLTNTYHKHYLPFSGPNVTNLGGMFTDTINNMTTILPPFPLLSNPRNKEIDRLMCPEKCDPFCECLNLIRIPLNSVIELVVIDTLSNDILSMDHPVHLHGHNYSVMKLATKEDLEKPDFYKVDKINEYPLVTDTIPIPAAGFAVLRFIASNPGFWTFHCHFTTHNHQGMLVVFQVGDPSEFPKLPNDWPKCGDYLPPVHNEF